MSKIASILVLGFGLAVSTPGSAQDRAFTAEDYAQCLSNAARKLELSGESASDVSIAAERVCRAMGPRRTDSNVMGELTDDDRKSILALLRSDLQEEIIRYVVEVRACRKDKVCAPSSIRPIPVSEAVVYLMSPGLPKKLSPRLPKK